MNDREQRQLSLLLGILAHTIYKLQQIDPEGAGEMLTECRTCGIDIRLIPLWSGPVGGDPSLN